MSSTVTDPDLWRSLKVGDKVRIVHMPTGYSRHTCHRDTLRAYRRLLLRKRPLRVSKLDDWSMPWVRFRFKLKNGKWEYHGLLVNHDGLVMVRPRSPNKRR